MCLPTAEKRPKGWIMQLESANALVLQLLQPDTTFSFLGWVAAGFSIGKLIASPLVGVWANFRRTREPLLGTLILLFGANILYMYLQSIPWHPEIFLLVVRILMGVSDGES
ncbi:MFSD8-like protein [Mya arenaria]|uniref:MFSD8-like protein n=1 Tax=Mya arenaria TaxID=6604 RepID=A0ABY7G3W8_MYAAR|nr:MFSD8-like protein [Mya arenaria]